MLNRTPYDLSLWWLDGQRGIEKEDIKKGAAYVINTYISHTFFARAKVSKTNNQSTK